MQYLYVAKAYIKQPFDNDVLGRDRMIVVMMIGKLEPEDVKRIKRSLVL